MTCWSIGRPQLKELLKAIVARGDRLVAPVRAEEHLTFEPVTDVGLIEHEYGNTTLPPKEYLLPRTEPVLRFGHGSEGVEVTSCTPDERPTVLFGVRPCDAAGIDRMTRVFSHEVRDELFLRRLERTTIMGMSCMQPAPSCFCTAVGCGPTSESGSDLLLTEIGPDRLLAEAITDKGRALVEQFASLFSSADAANRDAVTASAEATLTRSADLTGLEARLREAFSDPSWQSIGRGCLGCGACAYACPSCHCFDLIDDGVPAAGVRLRLWDCCAFPTFTVHASRHNPRPDQSARYRQRVLHKLSYFPERFGVQMCVGCGRCGLICPVGQDLYESATAFVASHHEAKPAEGR